MRFIITTLPDRVIMTAEDNSVEQIDTKIHGQARFNRERAQREARNPHDQVVVAEDLPPVEE